MAMVPHGNRVFGEAGISLISTIMITAILLACGFSVMGLSITEKKIAWNQKRAVQALYLAEAGVQRVLSQLRIDPDWNSGLENEPLGEGWIRQVEVKDWGDRVEILSTGEVDGIKRRLRVELIKTNLVSPYAVQTNNLTTLTGSSQLLSVTGDMVVYGDFITGSSFVLEGRLLVQGNTRIEGGSLSGSITGLGPVAISPGATVRAHVFSGEAITGGSLVEKGYLVLDRLPLSLPRAPEPPDFDWYQSRADLTLEEDRLAIENLPSGVYYVPENLNLFAAKAFQGRFIIISPNQVQIAANLVPQDPAVDSLIIIAREIEMAAGVEEIHGAFLASDTFQAKGLTEDKYIFGTIQSRQLVLSPKNIRISYRPCFVPGLAPGNQTVLYHISHWQEIAVL
ncbi:MAG: PilX N-terminal domain-containing pilus assembly protein [Bacillota bacterium]|jgi:hypothetical protein